ncbi:MAG: MATE family efflux transporter [Coprobacter sp.]|nr:MATE family efflux transporter [Coprobacter sp.]
MNRKILHIALPSIISNITVPLLSLVDIAITGHLGSPAYIGAIAIGGLMFNIIYWLFGFLRMGTSGMTAQAYGKRDLDETVRILLRAAGTGLLIALLLMVLQRPIGQLALSVIDAPADIRPLASHYFNICIWGAPAVLGLYGLSGWFIGMQNTRFPMFIAITQNIINIAASLCFVIGLKMKIEGVALGTLTAQYAGLVMALLLWVRCYYSRLKIKITLTEIVKKEALKRFFQTNNDIFLRTLCLVAVTTFFTTCGARQGTVILAVNTLLMQLFILFSYIMDGFAYAGEALVGKYTGAGNPAERKQAVQTLFRWGIGLAAAFTLLYGIGGQDFLALLTDDPTVIGASRPYFHWALAIPAAGFAAFLWDGIFIGATATRPMLCAMTIASALFFLLYYTLYPRWGNHALWLAFIVYLAMRGLVQTLFYLRQNPDRH